MHPCPASAGRRKDETMEKIIINNGDKTYFCSNTDLNKKIIVDGVETEITGFHTEWNRDETVVEYDVINLEDGRTIKFNRKTNSWETI